MNTFTTVFQKFSTSAAVLRVFSDFFLRHKHNEIKGKKKEKNLFTHILLIKHKHIHNTAISGIMLWGN